MTKLSEFKQAAAHVEALRRLRRLRQAYGCESSPPQRAIIELDVEHRPEPVVLSTSTRSALSRASNTRRRRSPPKLRALGVVIDVDGPL